MFLELFVGLVAILFSVKIYFVHTTKRCDNYVSLVGKTVVVTGANSGIGFYSALELAKRGGRIILACRDKDKAEKAKTEIVRLTGNNNVSVKLIDMSSLKSVMECAKNIGKEEKKLDILVNNAGVAGLLNRRTTDGINVLMQVNYFGPVLFTLLLLDLIRQSPNGRIINVASLMAKVGNFDAKMISQYAGRYGTYSNSKLCNILFTIKLAEKLKGSNTNVFSLHPGAIKTNIFRRIKGWRLIILNIIAYFTFKTPEEGAQTIIYTATEHGLEKLNGKHFEECSVTAPYSSTTDDKLADKVWEETFKVLQLEEKTYF